MCGCKDNKLKRAKVLLHNRDFDDLHIVEQGQIHQLYFEEFQKYGTDEDVINWLLKK